ncbi:CSEP0083 putative effector protein [Blumeria hordei DH14]|uniref:CSEP0083 putative effector protein n=1 Tax=Blumeria graminis f. sp. hordei (strain DH14) TaxID=546991 RepID=N1JDF8_BLUG1|nr:CSEP0083 putative effector protein [Blumeria hordei DH14]
MKFFSSATTAALAGLLLLVPAANGEQYFKCHSGRQFTMERVRTYANYATTRLSQTIEPTVDEAETRVSFEFDLLDSRNEKYYYLVQFSSSESTYYVFELGGTYWQPCSFHRN